MANEMERGGDLEGDGRYIFGTPEEVDNRTVTGFKSGGLTPPSSLPTHFEQIPFGGRGVGAFNRIGSDQFGIPPNGGEGESSPSI